MAFIRLAGPDALPGLKELFRDLGGVSEQRTIRLPESRGAGSPMKESAAGGELSGDGFPPGRGEVLVWQSFVRLSRFGLVYEQGKPGGRCSRGDMFGNHFLVTGGKPSGEVGRESGGARGAGSTLKFAM